MTQKIKMTHTLQMTLTSKMTHSPKTTNKSKMTHKPIMTHTPQNNPYYQNAGGNILQIQCKLFPVFKRYSQHLLWAFFIIVFRKSGYIEQGTKGIVPGKTLMSNRLCSNIF